MITMKVTMKGITTRLTTLFLISCFCASCTSDNNNHQSYAQEFVLLKTPSISGGEPNLTLDKNGTPYLSWVEYEDDSTDVLQFSLLETDTWSQPRKVAEGTNWFVNWADFPSLVVHPENRNLIAAHWLQKSALGTFDYDVRITVSNNGGLDWGQSFVPHRDSIAAEHGFVSMLSLPGERFFATWLDGRNTKTGNSHDANDAHAHGGGPMTLRAATFDAFGQLSNEVELDNRVCDCCQTTAVLTQSGVVVAYRDRSESEIRDISIVRQVNGFWTNPIVVSNDQWKIAGCPVNGPAMDAIDNHIAICWFTGAKDVSKVQVIFSVDGGATFSKPLRIDQGNPIGRVDVAFLSKELVMAAWLEQTEKGAELFVVQLNADGTRSTPQSLITMDAARSSGFPRMIKMKDRIIFAWTDVNNASTSVKTGYLMYP